MVQEERVWRTDLRRENLRESGYINYLGNILSKP